MISKQTLYVIKLEDGMYAHTEQISNDSVDVYPTSIEFADVYDNKETAILYANAINGGKLDNFTFHSNSKAVGVVTVEFSIIEEEALLVNH